MRYGNEWGKKLSVMSAWFDYKKPINGQKPLLVLVLWVYKWIARALIQQKGFGQVLDSKVSRNFPAPGTGNTD